MSRLQKLSYSVAIQIDLLDCLTSWRLSIDPFCYSIAFPLESIDFASE